MENQNFEEDRLVFLDQYKNLFQKKMFSDALALAEERLKILPMDANANLAAGEALIAMGLMDKSRCVLRDVETHILTLSQVFVLMGELYAEKGYEKDAQLCYLKFMAFNSASDNKRKLACQRTVIEDTQKVESKTNQQDNASSSDHLINTLSGWLANIHRIKTHATNDQ